MKIYRFPGNPTQPEFDDHAPPIVPANIFFVGRTVQTYRVPAATSCSDIVGWRIFDVRTGFYDSESRVRKMFTIRCFLKDHPRWQRFTLPSTYDLVQIQGRLVGRLKEKDSRFQYLCCRIEDFTLFGSQPKSEKPTLPGSTQYGSSLDKSGMPNTSTQSAQSKSWTARSKSRILQQDLLSRSNPLNDTTAISAPPSVTSSTPTDPKTKLLKSPKRSHTQAFNSKPDSRNVDNSSTSSSLPPSNGQFPTPTSSSQPESPLSSPEIISDNDYIPATQPLQAEEAPRRSIRSRKSNSRFIY